MRNQESITEEIRTASDIVEIIGQHVSLKSAGKDYKGLCPFHKEKTASFHVRLTEQYFKCFGCGKAGDVFGFLMELNSIGFVEARQLLADRANIRIDRAADGSGSSISRVDILRVNQWAMKVFQECLLSADGSAAGDYLVYRKISGASIERFDLGFAPDSFDFLLSKAGRAGISTELLCAAGLAKKRQGGGFYDTFRNRLMFPIFDVSDRVLAFGGRTLGDDPAKYLNSPETAVFHKGRCLYGLNFARHAYAESERAVLVEGYTDVIMAHQHGFTETVAPLGTALTDQQCDILKRYVPKVVLVFDADEAGQRASDRGMEIAIKSQLEVFLACMPAGLDPCDYLLKSGSSEFEDLLNSALAALAFKWKNALREHHDGGSQAARLAAVRRFVEFVGTTDAFGALDKIARGLLVNQIAHLVGVPPADVSGQIEAASGRAQPLHTESGKASDVDRADRPGGGSRPRDAQQAAALDLLAVLICEPGLHGQLADAFDPRLFSDEQLRRIAQCVIELIDQVGEFSTVQLLEKLSSASDSARAISLLEEGRSAGQLVDRLNSALERLNILAAARSSSKAQKEWFAHQAADSPAGSTQQNQKLAELHQSASTYSNASNFASIRKIKVDAIS